jgi:hypothetical protein
MSLVFVRRTPRPTQCSKPSSRDSATSSASPRAFRSTI